MENTGDLLVLRPVARMAYILGEHLIKDNVVGVLELVKNGYDADAENVIVELRCPKDPVKTEIMVQDDGVGMDEDTIRGPWSEPAHGGKQNDKNMSKRTARGRLPLGEKGVGRFAAQKLGKVLEMVTRPKGGRFEFLVTIDWDDFNKSDAYLDQIRFPLEMRAPEVFTGDRHGTRLLMKNSTTPWKRLNVEALQAGMMRLLSPSRKNRDFGVVFSCTEYPELQDLERGSILEKFQFKMDCRINESGIAAYTYAHRSPDGTVKSIEEQEANVWASVNKNWRERDPECGPLRIILYAWMRRAADLKEYAITKKQLDALSGVSIYRDGFRIIPYGDGGNDWLRLDLRRTNQPSKKYGNNQIIGQIEITQNGNRNLVDKTDREGLWENNAYSDMKDIALGVIGHLERDSLEERGRDKMQTGTTKTPKAKITDLGKQDTKTVSMPETAAVEPEPVPVPKPPAAGVINRLDIKREAKEADYSSDKYFETSGEEKLEGNETFLHLMALGLYAERFAHEFDSQMVGISANLAGIEKRHPHDSLTKALRSSLDQLKHDVGLILAAEHARKFPQEKISIKNALGISLSVHQHVIKRDRIHVEPIQGEDFEIRISPVSISHVLDNVVSNTLYWLNQKSEINDRRMHIALNRQGRSITISDNAVPIQRSIKTRLFREPFVTTKPRGRGLGLYISNKILEINNGKIDLLPESDPRNMYKLASFIIDFHQK